MKPFLKSIILLSIVVVLAAAGVYAAAYYWEASRLAIPAAVSDSNPGLPLEKLTIGNSKLTVEIASTAVEQEQGLSGRTALAADSGMLFPFSVPARPGFWMPNMNFPLDFIYIHQNQVVEIKENIRPAALPVPFYPAQDIDAVLEVNAGWVSAHGVKAGDVVK